EVMESYHPLTIGFKMGSDEEGAAKALLDRGVNVVVVNTPDVMGASEAEVTIFSRDGRRAVMGSKEEVAAAIWTALQ
ncbi:MAG: bifunctional phosphopantothenoylcysteine decarboxylase/phosphopantothenate--cysteine ligase CoaBC, partial [Methanomicrobiales archaeon]|nr:bifunctional phosphopantothenoylcysteine decarboxylase/phosphopantothenate--cysteine ligase CoaBC [Methanomicrobiales archaeon]